MLGLKSLRKVGLQTVNQARFSRTSLRGKKLVFEWQKQTQGPLERPARWMTDREAEEETQKAFKARYDEDYRRELFDLNPKTPPPPPVNDEVYGSVLPESKVFDRVTVSELYATAKYPGRKQLQDLKISFIRGLLHEWKIYDRELNEGVTQLKGLIANLTQQTGRPSAYDIPEEEMRALFAIPEAQAVLESFQRAISRTNYKNIPVLLLKLTEDVGYTSDSFSDVPIFETLHSSLAKSLHVLTPSELATAYYALNFRFPKMGSLGFRRMIRELIEKLDFNTLSLNEIITFFFAFRTDVNHTDIQNRCTRYFIDKFEGIQRLFPTHPTLALEILYTYGNCKLPKRFYKRFKILPSEEREDTYLKDRMEHLYMPHVLQNLAVYREPQFLQLLSILKVMNLFNYDEVYLAVTRFILRGWDSIDSTVLASLLYQSVKNNIRGFGSRAFWKEVSQRFMATADSKKGLNSPSNFLRISYALAHNKVLPPKAFAQKFERQFIEAVEDPSTDFGDLSISCLTTLYLDLADQAQDHARKMAAAVLRVIVRKNQFIPLFYYAPTKYFLWYFSKRFPQWNFEPLETLSYHAEKHFSTSRLYNKQMTGAHSELASIIKKQLNLDIVSLVDFQNLFLIDFAHQDLRFGVLVKGDFDVLYHEPDEERVSTGLFDLKAEILAQNKWTVCIIDQEEFRNSGPERAKWLKQLLEDSFKKANAQKADIIQEKLFGQFRRDLDDHLEIMARDPTEFFVAPSYKELTRVKQEFEKSVEAEKALEEKSGAASQPKLKQEKHKK